MSSPIPYARVAPPEGPIIVGIDGGYVRSWEDRKINFEVIVGKSVPEERKHRYFGLVQIHDDKPKRRLYEVLQDRDFQMNQDITFLTDGGDSHRRMVSNMSRQRFDQEALLQEGADAIDAGRRAPSPADPRSDPRRRPPRHFRKMVPGDWQPMNPVSEQRPQPP